MHILPFLIVTLVDLLLIILQTVSVYLSDISQVKYLCWKKTFYVLPKVLFVVFLCFVFILPYVLSVTFFIKKNNARLQKSSQLKTSATTLK